MKKKGEIAVKADFYIRKIIENTGLSKKEIRQKVEEIKKQLKGLVSDEGALFIILKESDVGPLFIILKEYGSHKSDFQKSRSSETFSELF